MIRLLIPLLLCAGMVRADESIVSGLSQNRVSITADFDGSEILIYGAVKRETPVPEGAPLEVIITVEGPATPVTVRRKDRVFGIWVNNAEVTVDSAPSFYAVATTGPLHEILSDTENLRRQISIERVIRAVGITDEAAESGQFVLAMLRVRTNEDRYRVLENRVELTEDTLFRTDVVLPANLTEGDYKVRLFLLRDGRVVAEQSRVIGVRKEGLERFIFTMAHEQPLLYGLLSLLLAGMAGWGASAAFRFIRI
ncbi:TIGR02186 family protein [Tabrizicola sp.]|uniref:TIGR02186 family protein n=1 Tax=Tabrizicola sp. TaxID=2005166 RepID=UPI00286AF790|nr:TIGR02186 family protein [Tabrizicola sp.]